MSATEHSYENELARLLVLPQSTERHAAVFSTREANVDMFCQIDAPG
jgi:hypothetical protein